ncbi:MAG: hypothetical protein M0T74_01435 [Desulfitobacterium hafniense]|nr:hypothetical protein [Desulfitobacterium hafniense]
MADEKLYRDKFGNNVSLKELMKGKDPQQNAATKFFFGIPIKEGCFKKEFLTLAGYNEIVHAKRGTGNYKDKALIKLGLDEDQVKEVDPVCFEGYRFEYPKLEPFSKYIDGTFVSSMYEITWIFFGNDQVYVYNHSFDTTDSTESDKTLEYFYKDITAFATSSDSVPRKVWITTKKGCSSETESQTKNVNSDLFQIKVPGDTFSCALRSAEEYTTAISAMKQKLRDKKNQ